MNIKSVIEQVDLVEYAEKFTDLEPCGSQYRGICPICKHENKTEFTIYEHKRFCCFVCGKTGDVINLIQYVKEVDFFTAVEYLAEDLNIDIEKDEGYKKRKTISTQYKEVVGKYHARVKVVEEYLKKRGLKEETIKEFELGANEQGSVVIPYIDENGRYVGMALRRFEGSPKYINSKNNELFTKSEYLYNLRGAKGRLASTPRLKNVLLMVEGYFCAMTLHQEGYAAVAYNSSHVTRQQSEILQRLHKTNREMTVVIIPDNDGVGTEMLKRTRRNMKNNAPDVPVMVMELPEGIKDINELYAAGRFGELKTATVSSLDECVLERELEKCATVEAERKVTEKYIKEVSDPITREDLAEMLSERWDVEKEVVREFLKVSLSASSLQEDFKNPQQCYEETRAMLTDKRLQYGITMLDEGIRGGGRRKDVTFIGASAGAGKTFLTVQMCVDMVVRQLKNAIYFSMEMSAGALYERVLSNLLGKPTDVVEELIKRGDPAVESVLEKLKEHLYVVDKNGLTIKQIDAYVREANVKLFEGQLDVVFIDYIQYMRGCTEYQVLAETAKGMKPLAKDNNIHVVVISQLNRGSKTWEKPNLGDLKGGGDLEASADNVFLMWRPDSDPKMQPEELEYVKNVVMMSIAKARNGATVKEIRLEIDPATSRMRVK